MYTICGDVSEVCGVMYQNSTIFAETVLAKLTDKKVYRKLFYHYQILFCMNSF